MNEAMRECIRNCVDCHGVCLQTIADCLELGGAHAGAGLIRLLFDCAQICETCSDFMLRDSDLHPRTCAVCAEVCERCAQACERFSDDARMQACAAACRQCASSCRQMAMAIA
jgi:hypothetical protein